jgi:glycosyltransferase involved in cell wall biosynthesis
MSLRPAASVIVSARNAEATLERALACLIAQDADFGYEVVLVDHASSDSTAEIAAAAGPPVRLIHAPGDGTTPVGPRNLGVAEARGGILAFTDADCFATPRWLAAGVRALERADLVQGRVVPDPSVPMGPFDRSLWVTRLAGLWETANLFITRELFDAAGGFEDWLAPDGRPMGEDVWLGWRAERLRGRSAFCAEALVHHAVFPRGARDYVAEHARRRHFPEIVARVPELRRTFLHRRWFLDARTAAFDGALAGVAVAAASRRAWPALAAVPYLRRWTARARTHPGEAATVLAADAAADLVGAWSLARGSLEARTPVL